MANSAGPPPLVIPASGNGAVRAITGWFMSQHAVSPGDAIPYKPADPLAEREFAAMLARGVIKRVGGGYWLDTAAYVADHRGRQARLGAIFGGLAVVAAVALMLLY
jgi:hypothetical protein